MGKIASSISASFVLSLGDNFYFAGVPDVSSDRFLKSWSDVYDDPSLRIPWYIIAGNHDHDGSVSAQISYSSLNELWKFPSLYHSHGFVSLDGSTTLDVLLIDTVELCSSSARHLNENDAEYFEPLPTLPKSHASEQWSWLSSTLQSSVADFVIVVGHYPVYSPCEHGNTETLVQHLKPLLQEFQAHYFGGHDHCLSAVQESGSPVNYFVSGMGETCCYKASNVLSLPEKLEHAWWSAAETKTGGAGFAAVTIGGTSSEGGGGGMDVVFYDEGGHVLYRNPTIGKRDKALLLNKNSSDEKEKTKKKRTRGEREDEDGDGDDGKDAA